MTLFAEIWSRPGAPTFGRVIDEAPSPYFTFHDGVNLEGDGTMQIAAAFDRFDEILFIDEATPANCVSSIIRIFDDSDTTVPVFEWIPQSILPTTDKRDPNVDISGRGVKSVLGYARVEAWDWDGSDDWASLFPDWIYGGRNLLNNPGFEDNTVVPRSYQLIITATGGNFTISDGTDTTANIAWNASASTIQTRLETDLASIVDVVVAPTGGSFIITLVTPPIGIALTVDPSGLTGGTATLPATEDGGQFPDPWRKAAFLVNGLPQDYGNYINFGVSDVEAHSGSFSLLIHPGAVTATGNRNAGAQQVVSVTPGGIYQAAIWVFPTSGTDEYRLGIFGIGEEIIAFDANGVSGGTLTPNVWNQLTISDIIIPEGVSQIIFRIQCTNQGPSNPSVFYVDDAEFNEGLDADTMGKIFGDLYDDAVVDHVADGRLVWEDEANPGTPYLTLDFTDTHDSGGNTWTHPEIEIRIWMRMTYLQVMEQFVSSWGYEWRIVPDDVELGTWKLQVYNPGGMRVDYRTAQSPAIQGGAQDTRRSVRRFLVDGTDFMVEGLDRLTSRARDTDLITALGRIESSRIDKQLPSQTAVDDAAQEDVDGTTESGLSYSYTLVNPQDLPLTDYLLGDVLTIHDPPLVNTGGRFVDVECVVTPESTEWEVQFVPATEAGS